MIDPAIVNQPRPSGDFLSGGGEMGALMRARDWASTSLGAPARWPTALKTALRLLLTSNHPMFIWWGPELIQFYNDAYRQTMDAVRHPAALGQGGRVCWAEIWDIIGPQIEYVMSGRGATWHEDQLVPITRHGALQNIWWTYGFSPIEDEQGVRGVLVICNDVTREHESKERLRQLNSKLAEEVQIRKQAEAALALEHERINAALGKTQDDLARQASDWKQLHALSAELLQRRSLRGQMLAVLQAVASLHRCSKGVISLYDPENAALAARVSLGLTESGIDQLACIPLGAGACGTAFRDKCRIVIPDTETHPLYADYRQFAREQGIRALYSTPFFSSTGEPLGVLSVYFTEPKTPDEREMRLTDICSAQIGLLVGQDRAQRQLQQEQARSYQILQTLKEGFLLMDRDFRALQINAAGLAIDGRQASDILGRTHWEIWPGSEHLPIGQFYKRVMREREPASMQHCYQHDGRDRWFDVYAYPYEDGIAAFYRDITQQKQTELELLRVSSESERRKRLYETFLSNSPDLAYVFDLNHRFTYANEVLLQMWGKTWEEAIGKNCLELGYEPWHAEMHGREIEQVKASKQPIRGEVPFAGTFGRRIYDYIFVPVLGPDGEVEAIAGTTRDVTERKTTEDALQEANRRKDEFLAMLAHELRNPLAPIGAAADLLALGRLDAERVRQTSAVISRQVKHMVGLIDDLLDVSRVTRGLARLDKTRLDAKKIVADAVEQVRPLIEARKHRLALHMPPEATIVLGDQKRLVQVLANLLNNAAKYTPEGGNIVLTMLVDGSDIRIQVEDNGIGMDAGLPARVFDLFVQAERSSDRSQGGLGIGLALVKSLVELHEGSVTAHSEGNGTGSRFTVALPRVCEQSGAAGQAQDVSFEQTPARPLKILIVDDNVDAAQMLALYVEALGHRVFIEHSSEKALDRARMESPDLCLLDIGLPDMDGNELARRLRALPETEKTMLAAVTGYGQEQDRNTAMNAGFAHHFVKPVDTLKLARLLAEIGQNSV